MGSVMLVEEVAVVVGKLELKFGGKRSGCKTLTRASPPNLEKNRTSSM